MKKKELTRFHGLLNVENIQHIRDMAKLYEVYPSEYLDMVLDHDRRKSVRTVKSKMEVRV